MAKENNNSMDLTGATKQVTKVALSQSVPPQPRLTREDQIMPEQGAWPQILPPFPHHSFDNDKKVSTHQKYKLGNEVPAITDDEDDDDEDDEAKMSELSWREVGDLCKKVTVHSTVPGFAMTITAVFVGALVKFPIRSRL